MPVGAAAERGLALIRWKRTLTMVCRREWEAEV
jgi:hypothetical protein